ncbi:MAG: YceI family protein [Candidatus Sulfotelmatobacter sp.]
MRRNQRGTGALSCPCVMLSTNFDSGVEMWTRQLLCIADAVGFPIDGQAGFQLTGHLTVYGVTREVTWRGVATFTKNQVAGRAMTSFTFGTFGLAKPQIARLLSVDDKIALEVEFKMHRN